MSWSGVGTDATSLMGTACSSPVTSGVRRKLRVRCLVRGTGRLALLVALRATLVGARQRVQVLGSASGTAWTLAAVAVAEPAALSKNERSCKRPWVKGISCQYLEVNPGRSHENVMSDIPVLNHRSPMGRTVAGGRGNFFLFSSIRRGLNRAQRVGKAHFSSRIAIGPAEPRFRGSTKRTGLLTAAFPRAAHGKFGMFSFL